MRRILELNNLFKTKILGRVAVMALLTLSALPSYAAIVFRAVNTATVQTQVGVTPTFIQFATGNAGASGATSLTINKPGGTLTNHVMVAQITIKGIVATITTPANWNLINKSSTSTSGSEITQAVYWHVATASEPASNTWSWASSARATGGIATFSNVEAVNPVDVWTVRTTNNNATITIPSITTTSGNEMLVALLGSSANTSHTTATGMNEKYDIGSGAGPNGVTVSNNTFLQVTGGVVAAKTATTGSAVDNIAHFVALRPLGALTINVPTGTTTNDVMIASISYRPCSNTSGANCTTTISPPAGWTLVNTVTDQKTGGGTDGYGNRLFIYQRVVTGIEPASYTWNFGGTPMQAGAAGSIASFSGVDNTTPIDAQAGQATTSSSTHAAPSIVTTVVNTMLVSSHLLNSSGTWTPPTGMTERVDIASRAPTNDLGIALEVNTEARAAIGATLTRTATASNPPAADTGITHMLALRPVSTGLNHLEILHASGTGLTCAASTLTIKACSDAAVPCVTPYTSGVSGNMSATGTPTVNWAGGSTAFTIAVGSGSVTKDVQVTTAGTVTFGILSSPTPPSPPPTNATTCNFGSNLLSNNCVFTASLAGFIFSNTATGSTYSIPAQVSGIATPTLYLRALEAATTNPAVCTPAIISQTVNVDMGYICNDPATCQTGSLATINSTAIASSGTAVSLAFDVNGSAPITARYDDVGQITLNANKTVTPFAGATAITLNGDSGTYVVKPDHFIVSGIQQTAAPNLANPGATSASDICGGTTTADCKFVKAGEQFSVTVTAKNALGGTTKNYGKEIAAEGVRFVDTSLLPADPNYASHATLVAGLGLTNNPALNGTFGSFANGVAIADGVSLLADGVTKSTPFTWNEVGIIKLTPGVGDGDYLGAGDRTGTQTGNVGRFYAAKFALSGGTIANRTDLGTGCDTFTYMGEEMSAVFTLTAKAVDGTTTLQNYNWSATAANQFAKLNPKAAVTSGTGGPLELGAVDSATTRTPFPPCGGTPAHPCLTPAQATAGTFASGVANVLVPLTIYRDNASPAGPYALLDIGVAPQDGDVAVMAAYNLDTVNVVVGTSDHTLVSQTQARYGRLKLSNAYGSELLDLPIPVVTQYWNGTAFETNTADNCTTLSSANMSLSYPTGSTLNATNMGISHISLGGSPVGIFSAGRGSLKLTKPTGAVSARGSVTLTESLTAANLTYLQGAWTGVSYTQNPSALATFGVFKGASEFIYLRENY